MTDIERPKLGTIIYDLPEDIVPNTHYTQVTGDVDLVELFKAKKHDETFIFEHEGLVRKWLSFICGKHEASEGKKLPFNDKDLRRKLNHILWVLPSRESCNALVSLLQTGTEAEAIRDYSVINCGDNDCDFNEKAFALVQEKEGGKLAENKTLMLLSKVQANNIRCPFWSGIFMLCNFSSNGYAEYYQIADVVAIPWRDSVDNIKKDSFVFSFSSKKSFLFINNLFAKEYHNKYFSEDVDSIKKYFRQRLKESPVEYWSLLGKEAIDEDVIYEIDPKESRSLWKSHRLINDSALLEFIKDKAHRKALKVSGKKDSEKLEKAVEAIKSICSQIPAYLYMMDNKNVSLIDHLKQSAQMSSCSKTKKGGSRKKLSQADIAKLELIDFEVITGVAPSLFLELAEMGVLKTDAIDRLACDFRAAEIIPFVSSQSVKARSICPQDVGLVFKSMTWPDFKYQYREVDVWDQLLDELCDQDNENEDSIRTITMLLCYLQLLRPILIEGESSFNIDSEALRDQFLRVVSVKEDSDDIMSDFQQKDRYDLWDFSDSSLVSVNDLYKEKISDINYLEHLIDDIRVRSDRMIEHYNSSHSFNRYQRANEPYYSDDKSILLNVPQGEDEFVVEKGTVVIGRNAFLNCSGLTKVSFPKSIQIIEDGAFHGCSKLDLIEFPESDTGNWQVVFDKQIKKVAHNSFSGSGLELSDKDFFEKQYKTKPFFYQGTETSKSIKVWCVNENGDYTDSTGTKHKVAEEEGITLSCIHSNFKDNEDALKTTVRNFLQSVQSNSEVFYDVAPIFLTGSEKEIDERKRQIAFLFCATRSINAIQIGNLRFDEDLYKLIGKVMDERVSRSSVGGTIYLSFDINSAELNNQEFADFLKIYYSKRENVKADLVNFCHKHNIGMTFYPNTGVFIDEEETDPDNQMKVEENSYTIKIIYVSSSKLDSIAEELCKTYYQQSVLVEDEINNRAYFKKHPLVQPNMDTLEQDNSVLYEAFKTYCENK